MHGAVYTCPPPRALQLLTWASFLGLKDEEFAAQILKSAISLILHNVGTACAIQCLISFSLTRSRYCTSHPSSLKGSRLPISDA